MAQLEAASRSAADVFDRFDPRAAVEVFRRLHPADKAALLKDYDHLAPRVIQDSPTLTRFLSNLPLTWGHRAITSAIEAAASRARISSDVSSATPHQSEKNWLTIPESRIGRQVSGEDGLFLGYGYLGGGIRGLAPLFVVELTGPKSFPQHVAAVTNSEPKEPVSVGRYDPNEGLRAGKTVIAPFSILELARENAHKAGFAEMFAKVEYVMSSTIADRHTAPRNVALFTASSERMTDRHVYDRANVDRAVSLRDPDIRYPVLLVRAALNLTP